MSYGWSSQPERVQFQKEENRWVPILTDEARIKASHPRCYRDILAPFI